MRARVTIAETGSVQRVVVIENELGPELASCVVTTMSAWRFPFRPDRLVNVDFPMVFSPERSAVPAGAAPLDSPSEPTRK